MIDWAMLVASGLMSSGVVITAWIFQWSISKRRRTMAPPGMDVLGKSLLDCIPNSTAPIFSLLIWISVCFLVDIIFPLLPSSAAGWGVFASPLQATLVIDYVILVPILLWCYISIACDLREAGDVVSEVAKRGDSGTFWRGSWWAAVWAAGLVEQYFTIRTQVGACSSTPPWLWVVKPPTSCASVLHLNWQGAAHAALRGLDAMLAFGLAGTVIMAAKRRSELGGDKIMEARGGWEVREGYMQCKSPLRKLSSHLALAGFLAITIASLHFVTIQMHRHMMDPNEVQSNAVFFAQFFESTWAIWCVIAFIWAGIAIVIISRVYRRAREELTREERDAILRLKEELPKELRKDVEEGRRRPSRNAVVDRMLIDQFWYDYEQIHKYYTENSRPYPLPAWLTFKWFKRGFLSIVTNVMFSIAFYTVGTAIANLFVVSVILSAVHALFPDVPHLPCIRLCVLK